MKIGYQGMMGAFQEEAARTYFGEGEEFCSYPEFEDVIQAVSEGRIDYGVLPIENSSTGGVLLTYDLLIQYPVHIVGEQYLKISHHVLGKKDTKLEDVKRVYSHPEALKQCSGFLKKKNWEQIPYHNTATSAQKVSQEEESESVAIASRRAGEVFDLCPLLENVQDNPYNTTRFLVLSAKGESNEQGNKVSLFLVLEHKVGALFSFLQCFSKYQLNLSKIESRPIPSKPWAYYFFLDLQVEEESSLEEAIQEAKLHATYFRVLGRYKDQNQ